MGCLLTRRVIALDQLAAFAREFVSRVRPGSVIALRGPMGAGKTTFVRALVAAFGADDWVSSPTFQLLHHYVSPQGPIYHFDLYRLTSQASFLSMDFLEYMTRPDAVVLIEWPDIIEDLLPAHTIFVELAYGDGVNERVVTFSLTG